MMNGGSHKLMDGGAIVGWLREEGILELEDDFPEDGDLFLAGLDSMAVMQLVVAAEERFGAVLESRDLSKERLATPRALAGLIAEKGS